MVSSLRSAPLQPIAAAERYIALDVLRGAALLGVLLINLDSGFRGSLFAHILNPHTHAGRANYLTDLALAWVFEFKAFTLFSFLFGVGVGVQAERTAARGRGVARFLARRFAVLLAIGLVHLLLIWNGDILTLYAVCGLLLIPLLALPSRWLAVAGIVVVLLAPYLPFFNDFFPRAEAMRAQAELATRIYATGSWREIAWLRVDEALRFIAPLLISVLPRTFGLMLFGVAAWRSGVLRRPAEDRRWLRAVFVLAGSLGALLTTVQIWSNETGRTIPAALAWPFSYGVVLLAFAYGAGLLLWFADRGEPLPLPLRLLAATGRMALSNYLAQSVLFTLIFYGFGLGLFGRLGSAAAALLGVAVFAAQMFVSDGWLRRFRFGPMEWLWRSLSYSHWQPLRRTRDVTGG